MNKIISLMKKIKTKLNYIDRLCLLKNKRVQKFCV
jgi:hypothetical protein